MDQIIALSVFVLMFAFIISGKVERYIPALIGALCTIVFVFGICMKSTDAIAETLNLQSFLKLSFWLNLNNESESSCGINWATIIFFIGMMIMVEGLGHSGFFRWLCLRLAKAVNYKVIPIFVAFLLLSAFLAMFIDSITVILFMAAITIELSLLLKFNPIYMILPEIFCANLGGAATMSGDPPNIIIGTSLGLSFLDFVSNTGIIVWISVFVMILFYYIMFRKKLSSNSSKIRITADLDPKKAIASPLKFILSSAIFLLTVILLVTHAQTGITVASIGIIAGALTLAVFCRDIKKLMRGVDFKTVLFFLGLFVVVGGLEQTGALNTIADFIGKISGDNSLIMLMVILWFSAFASALVDNIPFAATMVPVIKALSLTSGIDISVLAWTLALGTDIGGNATPIGASANVIGTSIAEKNGYHISWGTFLKSALPASVLTLAMCSVYLIIRYI